MCTFRHQYDLFHSVTFLSKDNPAYKGCKGKDGERCMKKVIDEGNGNYRCEKCDISSPDFMYRLILKALVSKMKIDAFSKNKTEFKG